MTEKNKVKFNVVEAFTKRKITRNFNSLEELTNYIKSEDRKELKQIKEARSYGKGSKEYDKIKGELPCVAINFNYENDYIKGENVSIPTGYMYIDIDNPKFDMGDVDRRYVAAYWRSLSNSGYTTILKVEGLDAYHLKEQCRDVAGRLDIPVDFNAVSTDRLTVLSYDHDVYYNPNAETIILPAFEIPQDSETNNKNIGYDCHEENLIFNNLKEVVQSLNLDLEKESNNGIVDLVEVLGKKLSYAEYFLPYREIKEGEREKILSSSTEQLIALNPQASRKLLKKIVVEANKKMQPPLSRNEVDTIFNKKYNKRNLLKPRCNKKSVGTYIQNKLQQKKSVVEQ